MPPQDSTTGSTHPADSPRSLSRPRPRKTGTKGARKTSSSQHQPPTPPDGGWGWVVVVSSFTLSMLLDGVCFSVGIFFNTLRDHFGSSKADTAWVGSVLNGSYLIIGPLVSAVVNRFGCRPVAMFGSVFAAAAIFISAFSPNLPTLIATYGLLAGTGFGFIYLPAIVMVGYYFEKRRALATGIACCGSGIGAFVFAPLCNYLLEQYGWRGAIWILSGLVLNALVFSIFYRPLEEKKTSKCRQDIQLADKNESSSGEQKQALLSSGDNDDDDDEHHDDTALENHSPSGQVKPVISVSGAGDKAVTGKDVVIELDNRVDNAGEDPNMEAASPPKTVTSAIPDIIGTAAMLEEGGGSRLQNGEEVDIDRADHIKLSDLIQTVTPRIQQEQNTGTKAFLSDFQLKDLRENSVTRLAFSQEALGPTNFRKRSPNKHHHHNHHYRHHLHPHQEMDNPLRRRDIFYSGSLHHIPEYQSSENVAEYRRKVTKGHDSDGEECPESNEGDDEESVISRRRSFFLRILCDPVCRVFDFSLLKSPTFVIYGLSCTLCMAGFFVPFMYLPTLSMDLGTSSTYAAFLVSIIGIANTIGRVIAGLVSDQPWADCLLINNVALMIAGGVTICVPFLTYYWLFAVYSLIFGSGIAVFVSLRSIIMVELMGLQKLTNAFGLVVMCQGISSFLGSPVAGLLSDVTGNYNSSFYVAGTFLLLSGAICLPLRRISRWERRREGERSQEPDR